MWLNLLMILLLCATNALCTFVESLINEIMYPDDIKHHLNVPVTDVLLVTVGKGLLFMGMKLYNDSLINFFSEFVTKCFGDLGCFYTGPPFFHPKYRPITVPPANNTVTKFYLFTSDKPSKEYEVEATEDSLKNSEFNGNLPTKVVIHGYITKNISNFYNMKDALLEKGKYNVIVVDWTQNDGFPLPQAIANARLNAARLSRLLEFLVEKTPLKPYNVHMIGHSIGAHMVGWVGSRIKNIGRISGLDPCGIYFQKAPRPVRLDSTDADFVDIIHSNSGNNITEGFGLFEPIGHINFYPNGGNRQPGCIPPAIVKIVISTEKVLNACAHSRSTELYTASIVNSDCHFFATRCTSWENFQQGDCQLTSSNRNEMGFNAKKLPKVPKKITILLKNQC